MVAAGYPWKIATLPAYAGGVRLPRGRAVVDVLSVCGHAYRRSWIEWAFWHVFQAPFS